MGYILFLLVNGALFIRPPELFEEIEGVAIYETLILCCMAVSYPAILRELTPRALSRRPITVCAIGVMAAAILSHASQLYAWGARTSGFAFLKLVVYYMLLIALVNTPGRLRQFLIWLAACVGLVAVLGVLEYHQVIDIKSVEIEMVQADEAAAEGVVTRRLRSTGFFNDPNDLCLMLLVGILLSVYFLGDPKFGGLRYLWLAPIAFFLYAVALTESRGGFIAMLVGAVVFVYARWGWKKTLPIAGVLLPSAFVLFAGRQTAISLTAGTGQSRIQLWAEGLSIFRQNFLFGVGEGVFVEYFSHVTHNSFVDSYVEMGFLGGTLFLGCFYVAIVGIYRVGSSGSPLLNVELRRMRPYVLTLVSVWAVGLLSLSRGHVVPTYTVLGIGAAYAGLGAEYTPRDVRLPRWGARLVPTLVTVSVGFVATTYAFVRVMVRWS